LPRAPGQTVMWRRRLQDRQAATPRLLISAREILRARFRGLTTAQLVTTCAPLRPRPTWGIDTRTVALTARTLARRIRTLDREAAAHQDTIARIVRAWRPDLLHQLGVGPIIAATMLSTWSHPGRIRSEAAFAMLAGTAPIPASSGQTIRYRLNRSGDRHLNQALHTIALTRLRFDQATRAYATRRRTEGKTDPEIRRCLKRYIAQRLYRLLEPQSTT
jgi:transposase